MEEKTRNICFKHTHQNRITFVSLLIFKVSNYPVLERLLASRHSLCVLLSHYLLYVSDVHQLDDFMLLWGARSGAGALKAQVTERDRALWKEGNRDTKKPSKLNRRVIKSWVECSQEEGYPAQSYTERRRDEAQRNLKLRLLWTNESSFLSSAPPVNGSAASLLRSEIWCDRALPWDKDVPLTSPWRKASRSWCSLWASSCLGLSGNTSSHFHRLWTNSIQDDEGALFTENTWFQL